MCLFLTDLSQKVLRQSVMAFCNIPGFTPRNTKSHTLSKSPFLLVTLAPRFFQCWRLSKWGPDTQILDAG